MTGRSRQHPSRTVIIDIHTRCRFGHERTFSPAEFHAPGPRLCTCGHVLIARTIIRTPWKVSLR